MKFPRMRGQLRSVLESLSNRSYQEAAWVRKEFPPGIEYDNLDLAVHFFFDDTELSRETSSAIGLFLYDEKEANAVRAVVQALDLLFERYGTALDDSDYIHKPEWEAVLRSATEALSVLDASAGPEKERPGEGKGGHS